MAVMPIPSSPSSCPQLSLSETLLFPLAQVSCSKLNLPQKKKPVCPSLKCPAPLFPHLVSFFLKLSNPLKKISPPSVFFSYSLRFSSRIPSLTFSLPLFPHYSQCPPSEKHPLPQKISNGQLTPPCSSCPPLPCSCPNRLHNHPLYRCPSLTGPPNPLP